MVLNTSTNKSFRFSGVLNLALGNG